MEWQDREESQNVEDRRGLSGGKMAFGGGIGGVILIIILALVFKVDPQKLLGDAGGVPGQPNVGQEEHPADPEEENLRKFTSVILHDTEEVWDEQFRKMGKTYQKPVLVLFSGQVESGCGHAAKASGPFYCPADSKLYIDLSFYRDMQQKLNAPGDFARAYVVAHEVGHHVQKLLGYSKRARDIEESGRQSEGSVRLELQADYLAGVWAYHGQRKFNFLREGDVESALNAAFEIGDDRLQKKAGGYVVPDSFTHGSSKQRMRWFQQGLKTGDVNGARALFELNYNQL
jgi:predicted metalloprotease